MKLSKDYARVLQGVADDKSSRVIAEELGISSRRVDYIRSIAGAAGRKPRLHRIRRRHNSQQNICAWFARAALLPAGGPDVADRIEREPRRYHSLADIPGGNASIAADWSEVWQHDGFRENASVPTAPLAGMVLDRAKRRRPAGSSWIAALVTQQPNRLVAMLFSTRVDLADLTLAAELAGELPFAHVGFALTRLLAHESALVREGAIYGLLRHLNANVRLRLQALADNDPSPRVRQTASEALEARAGR